MVVFYCDSMKVAKNVLNELEDIVCSSDDIGTMGTSKSAMIEAYSNGREQGFCIKSLGKTVCISENRNSDEIVVYSGLTGCFSMQGNVPSNEIYRKAKYFSADKIKEAAEFIANYFLTE